MITEILNILHKLEEEQEDLFAEIVKENHELQRGIHIEIDEKGLIPEHIFLYNDKKDKEENEITYEYFKKRNVFCSITDPNTRFLQKSSNMSTNIYCYQTSYDNFKDDFCNDYDKFCKKLQNSINKVCIKKNEISKKSYYEKALEVLKLPELSSEIETNKKILTEYKDDINNLYKIFKSNIKELDKLKLENKILLEISEDKKSNENKYQLKNKESLKIFIYFKKDETVFFQEWKRTMILKGYIGEGKEDENGIIYGINSFSNTANEKKVNLINNTKNTKINHFVNLNDMIYLNLLNLFLLNKKSPIFLKYQENRENPVYEDFTSDLKEYQNKTGLILFFEQKSQTRKVILTGSENFIVKEIPTIKLKDYHFFDNYDEKEKRYKKLERFDDYQYLFYREISLEQVFNKILFSNYLKNKSTWNYFTNLKDVYTFPKQPIEYPYIWNYRDLLFKYFYKNSLQDLELFTKNYFHSLLQKQRIHTFESKLLLILYLHILHKYNWEDKKYMKEVSIETKTEKLVEHLKDEYFQFKTDADFYFGCGQLIEYLISQSQATKKDMLYYPLKQCSNVEHLKNQIVKLNHQYGIRVLNRKFKTLARAVLEYEPKDSTYLEINLIIGLYSKNALYQKTQENDEIMEENKDE